MLATSRALGPGPSHSDASGILLRWSLPAANRRDAIEIEADRRHSDLGLNQLILERTNTAVTRSITNDYSGLGVHFKTDVFHHSA